MDVTDPGDVIVHGSDTSEFISADSHSEEEPQYSSEQARNTNCDSSSDGNGTCRARGERVSRPPPRLTYDHIGQPSSYP
ncbi:hypothetical protein MHBO_003056 [Bonamia ostreae]|uniref:Uncharacterized protein n=1 Tax=Bonamia ostreae TaxID=126728 RepID=A0ABV2APE2_9EUKA